MNSALLTLLKALAVIGKAGDDVEVESDIDDTAKSVTVKLNYANGNVITILISEFWRYPGVPCYFVNFQHPNGDFSCNVGTPFVEQALVDIGCCYAMFVHPTTTPA